MANGTIDGQEELNATNKRFLEIVQAEVSAAKSANAIFIHTSDRLSYKKCRRRWNWVSKIRHNLRPIQRAMALEFGTAIHAAQEVFYNPETWFLRGTPQWEVVEQAALRAFRQSMIELKEAYLRKTKQEALYDEAKEEWETHFELGQKMLIHYFKWSEGRDNFTPVATELDFVVYLFDYEGRPVYYRGRIDLLAMDDDGNYWIWDHKTLARWMDIDHLDFDEQLGSYNWAVSKMLGIHVVGNIYNELWKAVPSFPRLLDKKSKGRALSTAKDQPTTYEAMLAAIDAFGENKALYEDYLSWLRAEGPQFFRRTQFHRNKAELEDIHQRIMVEAREMVSIPESDCYPNPDRFKCAWCAFRTPCLAYNDGSDVNWFLKMNYTVGEENEKVGQILEMETNSND
jgi:PD-(D/E)XK nuclease superfamily